MSKKKVKKFISLDEWVSVDEWVSEFQNKNCTIHTSQRIDYTHTNARNDISLSISPKTHSDKKSNPTESVNS